MENHQYNSFIRGGVGTALASRADQTSSRDLVTGSAEELKEGKPVDNDAERGDTSEQS